MDKRNIQMIWGAMLVMAGLGVFYRIPQVMPRIQDMEAFVNAVSIIRFCFYFLGVLLVYGGGRKLYENYKKK
ncbi:hypothetical protein [Desulfocicer niacini]